MKFSLVPKCGEFFASLPSRPLSWVALAVATLLLDLWAGPVISFPFIFIFPVALAAWHRGFRWGSCFAVGLPTIHFCFHFVRHMPWTVSESGINLGIRIFVLCGFAWLIARTAKQQRRIETLERLLPICSWCGKIRGEENQWQRLDTYLSKRTDLSFTHTICKECAATQFPQKSAADS